MCHFPPHKLFVFAESAILNSQKTWVVIGDFNTHRVNLDTPMMMSTNSWKHKQSSNELLNPQYKLLPLFNSG